MAILFQSHGGKKKATEPLIFGAGRPAGNDIAVDEAADFGYFVPPLDTPANYLPVAQSTVDELDQLGDKMIDLTDPEPASHDSGLPPILTYWGQFLDHELTARTDRDAEITNVTTPHPPLAASDVEENLRVCSRKRIAGQPSCHELDHCGLNEGQACR